MLPNEATTRSEVIVAASELEALVAAPGRHDGRPTIAFLKQEQLNVTLFGDAESAFEEALLHRPHILLIHDDLPPAGGIELIQRLKANTRTHFLPAVIVAREDSRTHRIRALAVGADAVFSPGMDPQERRTRLWSLLRSQTLHRRQEHRREAQGWASRAQRRWLGGFVHDLQNAVGALQANFEFVGQQAAAAPADPGEDLRDCLRETRTLLQQLTRALRSVQDYERISNGQMALRSAAVDVHELLVEVKEELSSLADEAGRRLRLTPSDRSWRLLGDQSLLRQALSALAAYLLRQPRTTAVHLAAGDLPGGGLRLRITSDGGRIAPEERDRVFEPYGCLPRRGAELAHGLGLALARVIVELHGGTVQVAEGVSAGAAFEITLKSGDASPNPAFEP